MNKKELIDFKLPEKYADNLIKIDDGLDNIPELIDFISCGKTIEEYKKFAIYMNIEYTKHNLKEYECESELSDEEINMLQQTIKNMIEEYNSL
ncbi:hypothetical protein [Terrisporobacter petrolearius]|uniref:hypothetical protein n=1 Tax=Terrisporobacter petrolearius TaxID=1460447 RepID=UPI0031CC98E3